MLALSVDLGFAPLLADGAAEGLRSGYRIQVSDMMNNLGSSALLQTDSELVCRYRAVGVGLLAAGSKAAMIAKSAGGIKGLSAAVLAAGVSAQAKLCLPSCCYRRLCICVWRSICEFLTVSLRLAI